MKHSVIFLSLFSPLASFAEDFPVYTGDEMVVTASRFEQKNNSKPVSVTVVTQDMIKNNPAATLPELLSQFSGIRARNMDGSPDMQIDLRGMGMTGNQNTLVLLDGQRLNEIELTSIRWSAIPLSSIDRIEIMRGSGAVLYGAGATGGVINIITKTPASGKKEGEIAVSAGSYNAKDIRGNLSLGGEKVGMNLSMNSSDTDNYRINNQLRQLNLEGDVRVPTDGGNASLKFGADSQALRFPGARSNVQLVTDPRGTSTPGDYGTRDGAHVALGADQNFGFGEFSAELAYRDNKRTAYFASFGGNYLNTQSNVLSLTPRLKVPVQIFGRENTLIAGLDWDKWDYNSTRSASVSTPALARILANQEDQAAYFLDTLEVSPATNLTLGGRAQQVKLQANDVINPAAYAKGSQVRRPKAFELGIRHEMNKSLALYGKVGNSFRIATIDEIYNQYGSPVFDSIVTMLEPQTSHDRELGMDYKEGRVSFHGAIYQMDINNEIHYNALTFTNMNLSPTRRQGIELEGRWQAASSLEAFASYTYAQAKFRSGVYGGVNVAGNNIPLVPKNSASLGASWFFAEKTKLNAVLNYVGSQHFDNDQANAFNTKMPAYTVADLKFSHETGAWALTAAANNLLNKQYYTYGVASTFVPGRFNAYPMMPRNFTLGAEYRFR